MPCNLCMRNYFNFVDFKPDTSISRSGKVDASRSGRAALLLPVPPFARGRGGRLGTGSSAAVLPVPPFARGRGRSYQKEKSPRPMSNGKSVMQNLCTQMRAVLQYGIAARSAA